MYDIRWRTRFYLFDSAPKTGDSPAIRPMHRRICGESARKQAIIPVYPPRGKPWYGSHVAETRPGEVRCIMSHNARVAGFVALAGDGFAWAGVRGSSRPPASVRRALRDDLTARQGGICPVHGGALGERGAVEFNHVVARGPLVKGFVAGNVFAGCAGCNSLTKPIYDESGALLSGVEVLTEEFFARADLIPLEWTPFPVLRRLATGE